MSWVSIDKDKCNECGLCVSVCISCFRNDDDEITVHADENCCMLCGHCVAVCPTEAIVHHQMDMDNFTEIPSEIAFSTDEFIQFVRRRRSHRHFKDKKVQREHIEALVDLCRYAPTGSNLQTVDILVVEDREKIQRLSDLTVDFFENDIDQILREAKEQEDRGGEIPQDIRSMLSRRETLDLVVAARKMGAEIVFHQAPAVMIFHSPILTSTPKDDCVIASTIVGLSAMTMGLGTCYIGLFKWAANRYAPLIEELALPDGHRVFSVLILGYPAIEFLRTVDRRPKSAKWLPT